MTIQIDGSRGEGGGQILRTALAISAWLGKPFEMTCIRAGRERPGLHAQHLAAVRGAQAICNAEVDGAEPGSTTLVFRPGALAAGNYRMEVGTAGATTLVAQACAPPLLRAAGTSRLTITGGSHVPWSPPLDYVRDVYAPLLAFFGFHMKASLLRYGFYPRGGGEIAIQIEGESGTRERMAGSARLRERGSTPRPSEDATRVDIVRPPENEISVTATAVVSSLPAGIAERMLAVARRRLAGQAWRYEDRIEEARGPQGAYIFIRARGGTLAQVADLAADAERAAAIASASGGEVAMLLGGFTGLGERGKPAENVARDAVDGALEFLTGRGSFDPRLADQLLLPAIMAHTDVTFTTNRVTSHLTTNAETIGLFLGPCVRIDSDGRVQIRAPAEVRRSPA